MVEVMKTISTFATICALTLSFVVFSNAAAQGAGKQTPARSIPVKKLFPFYDTYLRLPPDGRDGFKMVYRLSGPANTPRPQMSYALGALRTPVVLNANGQIMNMPDNAMLLGGRIDIPANQPRGGIIMDLEPVISLSRAMSVASAVNPLNDYASAVRSAGPLAAFAPKLNGIVFKGGTGGEAVFGDGRRIALPVAPRGGVTFLPAAPNMRGAISLAFVTAPSSSEFSQ
jgi:hypothetical protein